MHHGNGERTGGQARPGTARPAIGHLVGRTLAEVERELILATMTRCGGNRTFAADMLGLDMGALRERLLDYGRQAETKARDVARREAELEADLHRGDGRRATYVPSPLHLA